MSRSHFNDKWRAVVELAGLPKGTRFHDPEFSETWDTCAHPPVAVQGVKVTTFSGLFGSAQPGPAGPVDTEQAA